MSSDDSTEVLARGLDRVRPGRPHRPGTATLAEHPDAPPGPDWHCAEIAVHTWDLATALGRSTDSYDPEVAERGLAFMSASLTDDNRSPAFGPAQEAPDDADAYARLAAFAGRTVGERLAARHGVDAGRGGGQ